MTQKKFTESELEEQNSKIMSTFNFEKVHQHMVETNHQWHMGSSSGMKVPDIQDLRNTARSLLTRAAYSNEVINVGTGGFMVYKLPWGMSLTFQLAWS
jgi:hypothetical protein